MLWLVLSNTIRMCSHKFMIENWLHEPVSESWKSDCSCCSSGGTCRPETGCRSPRLSGAPRPRWNRCYRFVCFVWKKYKILYYWWLNTKMLALIYLKRNCSPSSSWSRGGISNTPVNEYGCPPYANSVPKISTPEWNTPNPRFVVYSLIQYWLNRQCYNYEIIYHYSPQL